MTWWSDREHRIHFHARIPAGKWTSSSGDAGWRWTVSPQNFDLLVLDAFSGDSVPFISSTGKLLIYFRHVKPSRMLAVN